MNKRREEINNIIADLKGLQKTSTKHSAYALEELIRFFNASRSLPHYIAWMFFHAPRLHNDKILEINDLPFSHHEKKMHEKLIKMEAQEKPGLIKLQVDALSNYILKEQRNLCIASLGSGGMETERQVLKELMQNDSKRKLVIVGFDYSLVAHDVAKQNLKEFEDEVSIITLSHLDSHSLHKIIEENKRYTVVLCENNIFTLDTDFKEKTFDVVFHTLFKHHLTEGERVHIDQIISKIAKYCFEYDGYRNWPGMIPQTIVGWNDPAFLNAEIFSNLRFKTKKQILDYARNKGSLSTHWLGYYLLQSKL